jgi:putative flavoprotein involved in K+ transport
MEASPKMPTLAESVESYAKNAKAMLAAQDFAGAAREGSHALEILPVLSQVATMRGHGLLTPLINRAMDDSNTYRFSRNDFKEPYEAFRLAMIMDPGNAEAAKELEQLSALLERLGGNEVDEAGASEHEHELEEVDASELEPSAAGPPAPDASLDVIVVGAGAAGIGCAHTLTNIFGLDASRVLLVDRGDAIGASFRMWPAEMRFISPSFNQQGWTKSFDLNSIAYGTSPAFSLHTQHPSGAQYADYLSELAEAAKLSVKLRTEVLQVSPVEGGGFDVHVRTGGGDGEPKEETLRARYVVWAAGEFQYPREKSECASGSCTMLGMELCLHNSRVRSWASLPGDDIVLIGGYESGADAAVNLAKAGKQATVLASTATWNVQTADPSTELAPYTGERLRQVTAADFSPRPRLLAPLRVERVERAEGGGYNVIAQWKAAQTHELTQLRPPVTGADSDAAPWWKSTNEGDELVVHTAHPPVLCTGFEGSVAASAQHLFNLAGDEAKGCLAGAPLLTKDDESTKVPGVFLVGPTVRHGELSFCFIYKFRQRFAIVADAICRGLGRDTTSPVEACRKMNMYLDDLECCADTCGSC